MSEPSLRRILKAMLAAAAATVAALFVYASVQQVYRTAADDPQIQLAAEAAGALRSGASIEAAIPAGRMEIASGLAPFVIAYDAANRPIAGSGRLAGGLPTPADGVLAAARSNGSHRVTWRPAPGVRVAAVLQRVDDGSGRVVLAGRSLRETEARTSRLLVMTALAWGGLMLASVLAALL